MSGSRGRETIHLSFGCAANAVTSHLCNLQGLACTPSSSSSSNNDEEAPLCDPNVTHGVYRETHIPRVLLVDGSNCFSRTSHAKPVVVWGDTATEENGSDPHAVLEQHPAVSTWSGRIEVYDNASGNKKDDAITALHETASSLATLPRSRYRTSQATYSSRFVHSSNNNNRHMTWDDEDNDHHDDDEEENEYEKYRRVQAEKKRNLRQEQQITNRMDIAWNDVVDSFSSPHHTTNVAHVTNENSSKDCMVELPWMQYFLPPHPPLDLYCAPLPFETLPNFSFISQRQDNNNTTDQFPHAEILNSYFCGYNTITGTTNNNVWRQDVLSEKIRKLMETCDFVSGFTLVMDDSCAFFSGLAGSVLEELREECKSASRFSILIDNPTIAKSDSDGCWRSETQAVSTFRKHLNKGLSLHGVAENSDLVLPISLSQCWDALYNSTSFTSKQQQTLFASSAGAALALEAATLPYRLINGSQKDGRSKIGVRGGGFPLQDDTNGYVCPNKLSCHEFVLCLRPSNRHVMLEMSGLLKPLQVNSTEFDRLSSSTPSLEDNELHRRLIEGTSIERRVLEEERGRNRSTNRFRKQDIEPGRWLEDCRFDGGILSSMSFADTGSNARTMHEHFALLATMRPPSLSERVVPVSMYLTSLMEGMGVRYRPQVSVGTVVCQSLHQLTSRGGVYWNSIFGDMYTSAIPVLTVLGNTTRTYPYLHSTSANLASSIQSRKFRGYMSRDSMANIAPEREDCLEAVEYCMTLTDAYEPPNTNSVEGIYFDDNED